MSKQAIAQTLGLDRRTVGTWLAADHLPERAPKARQAHRLDLHAAYIVRHYEEGLDNAAQLARELEELGIDHCYQAACRYLAELRRRRPRGSGPPAGPPSRVSAPMPSPRETAWLLRTADQAPETLTAHERGFVTVVCEQCPALAQARTLIDDFARLLARHDADALVAWLTAAEQSDVRELRAFAASVRRDQDAVLCAWSNGQTEGQIHRLKLLKRAMYGRASFALLLTHGLDVA